MGSRDPDATRPTRARLIGLLVGTGLVMMALDLIGTVDQLLAASRAANESIEERVVDILRANPHATWRVVREFTGLPTRAPSGL